MSAIQHRLTEFLDLELDHSLGAYRRARDGMLALEKRLLEDEALTHKTDAVYLRDLAEIMRDYNHQLENHTADASDAACRHPAPARLPLSERASFLPPLPAGSRSTEPLAPDATAGQSLTWIGAFYSAARYAIDSRPSEDEPEPIRQFRDALLHRRVPLNHDVIHRDPDSPPATAEQHRRGRRERYKRRFAHLEPSGIPTRGFVPAGAREIGVSSERESDEAVVATIVGSHLEARHRRPLAAFVMRALVDAHLALHEVESHLSAPLGTRLSRMEDDRQQIDAQLDRVIALTTFVFAAARTAPWMFAEDETERKFIVRNYGYAWGRVAPMRAMWISSQVSLLALHRRAFAYSLLGKPKESYNDFRKLQHSIRETTRRMLRVPVHVDGAIEFLDTLDALADHRIGELYRADRDYVSAQRHFVRSYDRLELLRRERRTALLTSGRWFVHLQLSLGKACYELGEHKASLAWYLRTWRSLLSLMAAEDGGEVSSTPVDASLVWLDRVVAEPAIYKNDAVRLLKPVVDHLQGIRIHPRFTLLASEILLRLGHLLFVLNLGEQRSGAGSPEGQSVSRFAPDDGSLAYQCVHRAVLLDRRGTLALSDALKLRFRAQRAGEVPRGLDDLLDEERLVPVAEQWPGNGSATEALSRAIEYVLLHELHEAQKSDPAPKRQRTQDMARELLHSFLTHTDSIETRKSQVHEYLTRGRVTSTVAEDCGSPAIEFICLRRYSSAYPILPRPQSFRAFGGGYFLRVHVPGGRAAFGIAVDPGTSFVDCLYRSGLSLGDIDVVVVTHDHVDHASLLDPLLALRHERRMLGCAEPLLVVGNESVISRWKDIPIYAGDSSLEFKGLDVRGTRARSLSRVLSKRANEVCCPGESGTLSVEITGLRSDLPGTSGHLDLCFKPSYGLLLEVAHGAARSHRASVALTSDLPRLPDDAVPWPEEWQRAFRADVMVCHLSSVPMSELRTLARLREPGLRTVQDDERWIAEHWRAGRAMGSDSVERRLRYSYWLDQADDERPVSPVGDHEYLDGSWEPPRSHPYLSGLLQLAENFARARPRAGGRVFIVGELSEELGSFRGKVAVQLNRQVFSKNRCVAITGDLGLRVLIAPQDQQKKLAARIMCSTCDLDNDTTGGERLHGPSEIFEVCVKGENEGTFYNCTDHNPWHLDDPMFIERFEHYDVFGR